MQTGEVSTWQNRSWSSWKARWKISSTRTPTTATPCSRCPAAGSSPWCAASWGSCMPGKASSAAAGTRTTPPMAGSSTRRSARRTCPRIWKPCTPSLPAGRCPTSGPRRRTRSSTCSGPRRWRSLPTTPPGSRRCPASRRTRPTASSRSSSGCSGCGSSSPIWHSSRSAPARPWRCSGRSGRGPCRRFRPTPTCCAGSRCSWTSATPTASPSITTWRATAPSGWKPPCCALCATTRATATPACPGPSCWKPPPTSSTSRRKSWPVRWTSASRPKNSA